ncbi:VOC family protein [Desulfobacula sp.]|uniref:VOC family protein n=1 Tax=Desulfobacula sp. TaxID=2593537 RepID=UPI00262911CF|nr:VOC family protein [Desulfobacula sp.]
MKPLLIDHIGIIVKNIELSLLFYQGILGLPLTGIEKNSEHNITIAFLSCGETLVELIQPTGDGAFKQFIETRGEGLHHLAVRVENIEESIDSLRCNSVPLLDLHPKSGSGASKIAFLDACAANNVSIELIER